MEGVLRIVQQAGPEMRARGRRQRRQRDQLRHPCSRLASGRYALPMVAARQTCATSFFGTRPRTTASASTCHSGVVRSSAGLSARLPAPLARCPTLALPACSLLLTLPRQHAPALAACPPPHTHKGTPTLGLLQFSAYSDPTPSRCSDPSIRVCSHGDTPHARHNSRRHRAHRHPAVRQAPGPRQPNPAVVLPVGAVIVSLPFHMRCNKLLF